MKTLKWIKLIGILCILFGINGLINNYVPLAVPEFIEAAKEQTEVPQNIPNWHLILAYIGLIVTQFIS